MKSDAVLTNTELRAVARTQWRRRILGIAILSLVTGVIGAWFVALPAVSLGQWRWQVLVAVAGMALVGIYVILRMTQPPATVRVLLGSADELQRQRSLGLFLFALFAALTTPGIWKATGKVIDGVGGASAYVLIGAVLVCALTHLFSVLGLITGARFKAIYNDEFSRHIRGRAVLVGFFVLFGGALGVFMLGLNDQGLAIRAVPLVLLYSVVATTVSYAIMDLRAEALERRDPQ